MNTCETLTVCSVTEIYLLTCSVFLYLHLVLFSIFYGFVSLDIQLLFRQHGDWYCSMGWQRRHHYFKSYKSSGGIFYSERRRRGRETSRHSSSVFEREIKDIFSELTETQTNTFDNAKAALLARLNLPNQPLNSS